MNNLIEDVLIGIRQGTPLTGSMMHDHGLEMPMVQYSQLHYENNAFVYSTWIEEPIVGSQAIQKTSTILSDTEAQKVLAADPILGSLSVR